MCQKRHSNILLDKPISRNVDYFGLSSVRYPYFCTVLYIIVFWLIVCSSFLPPLFSPDIVIVKRDKMLAGIDCFYLGYFYAFFIFNHILLLGHTLLFSCWVATFMSGSAIESRGLVLGQIWTADWREPAWVALVVHLKFLSVAVFESDPGSWVQDQGHSGLHRFDVAKAKVCFY